MAVSAGIPGVENRTKVDKIVGLGETRVGDIHKRQDSQGLCKTFKPHSKVEHFGKEFAAHTRWRLGPQFYTATLVGCGQLTRITLSTGVDKVVEMPVG